MRILFMLQAGALGIGGVTRCLAIAEEAQLWGHHVGFFCRPDIQPMLKELNLELYNAPMPPPGDERRALPFRLADSIKIRRMDDPDYLRKTIEAEVSAIRSFRPAVIFTENQFTAAISSALTRVPLVSTAASVNHPSFSSPLYPNCPPSADVVGNFNAVLREYRLPAITDVYELANARSALNVAPTVPELEPLLAEFPNIHHVGPLLYRRMELGPLPQSLKDTSWKLLVYVYMSVGTLKPQIYIPVLEEAFADLDLEIAVALREKEYNGHTLPFKIKNIHLHQYLPGSTLAMHSVMVVTRGGQNTIMSALLAGTPIVGFPGTDAEADFNVRGLAQLGASILGATEDFKPRFLRAAFHEIRVSPAYREAAAELGDRIRQYGGTREVVRLMEALS